jgi:hypothetical protein
MKPHALIFAAIVVLLPGIADSEPKATPQTPATPAKDDTIVSPSILLRVRRVTYEDAYIAVPATDTIMKKNPDGTASVDFDAFVAEAIRISKDKRVQWEVESSKTEAHPTQQPRPKNRTVLDAFYDLPANR